MFAQSLALLSAASMAVATTEPPAAEPNTGEPELRSAAPSLVDEKAWGNVELLTFFEDRHRRMTIPVTIEGEGPFNFMVDTGSQATVVTRQLGERLQLEPLGSVVIVGMASSKETQLVRLDGLEFASRVFDNIEAPLLEARHLGADGILGLDSLQDMRVVIDFRKEEMQVANASEAAQNRGYEIVVRARRKLGRLIITNAKIDGVTTALIIDTGAQGTVGNLALQKRLRATRRDTVIATDVNGSQISGELSYVSKLKVDDMVLTRVPITFADGVPFKVLGLHDKPAILLGMENLRAFDRVAIDFSSREILFDLPRDL